MTPATGHMPSSVCDKAILVTQSFHLPRALYTCNALGLKAIGVPSDQHEYSQTIAGVLEPARAASNPDCSAGSASPST